MRALAAGRADEDAVSLVPGSFEVGYVGEDGSAHRVALTDAWAVRFEATAPVRRFYSRKAQPAGRVQETGRRNGAHGSIVTGTPQAYGA